MRLDSKIIFFIFFIFFNTDSIALNYSKINTYSTDGYLQMIIEIPAGTNKKIEYDYISNSFKPNLINKSERIIDFLPYPGNYGFIPSTELSIDNGGDGDALDVLLISRSLQTGTVISVIPIGALVLEDSGEIDTKIIAVPFEENMRVIDAASFDEFTKNYKTAKEIIELWFLNYKGAGTVQFIKWEDENNALKEINKWMLD